MSLTLKGPFPEVETVFPSPVSPRRAGSTGYDAPIRVFTFVGPPYSFEASRWPPANDAEPASKSGSNWSGYDGA
jgi:hypothetical protein